MVVIMKSGTSQQNLTDIENRLKSMGFELHISQGVDHTIIGLIGDTSVIQPETILLDQNVERVMRVSEPYKKAGRKFSPQDTVITVGAADSVRPSSDTARSQVKIGGNNIVVIAGPCSVESEEQILEVTKAVKQSGAALLRGGAFKPRTSPYAFQGMELEGLALLKLAREQTGLPIVTEIMSPSLVETFDADVDLIQVGARNMQNFDLLKELGKSKKPILLKRGLSSTIEEWLMSAEYILAGGNPNVILCERGIRTFETYTRNTLDLSAVLAVKQLSHLPIVVDPSHATGIRWMVPKLSVAAVAAGADGLIVEVHNHPEKALCDGAQSLNPQEFGELMGNVRHMANAMGRGI